MKLVAGNQPSVPAVFEPTALHAEPFHLATWSACAIPAMLTASVPTYTSVPCAASDRTLSSTAPGPPMACHVPS